MAAASAQQSSASASLQQHLQSVIPTTLSDYTELRESLLPALIESVSQVADALNATKEVSLAGGANAFGDDQLNVDVRAEQVIRDALAQCPSVVTASSEEDPVERQSASASSRAGAESYTVAFDPLDGSSIIAPNWTVGAIFGIWQGATALHQPPAQKQVASVLGVFGPRTTAVVAVRIPGQQPNCFELAIGKDGVAGCEVVRPHVRFAEPPFSARYFAPANLRAAADDAKYMALINHFIQSKYNLRYCGGLVPDIVHALVKGHGVYVSPVRGASKAKLRRLFELIPIALIVECAGGKAVDPADGTNILDRPLEDINERAGLLCGTSEDVDFAKPYVVLQ